ncbi:MAG: 50S ribosomal protein L25/general stress protein Ctc [Bacteroidales bacterium]|nr:50S ribosomal protein L25/general stress protein Ctc [Bacteroidales bacterium]
MQTFDIKGSKRVAGGKKAAKVLRSQGLVPCIIYGKGEEIAFSVEEEQFRNLIYTPNIYIVNVDIEGQVRKAILKDLQFHPVSDKLLHVDFLEISDDKPVTIALPIKIEGNSEGVKAGGKLQVEMRKLVVKGMTKDLPDVLKIDITSLGLGKVFKVQDLKFEGLEILNAKNAVVVAVKMTRAAKSAADAAGK